MPIPSKRKDEDKTSFMSRCVGDEVMKNEYPDQKQRTAVCVSKAIEGLNHIEAADFCLQHKEVAKKKFKYEDPKTGEIFTYNRKGVYKKDGRFLVFVEETT